MTNSLVNQAEVSPYVRMEFHEKLRKLMKDQRFSQDRIAAELDVHQTQVSRWVRGDGVPDARKAFRLARLLDVTVDFLLDDSLDVPMDPSPQEWVLVEMVRREGISIADAIVRLRARPGEGVAVPAPAESPQYRKGTGFLGGEIAVPERSPAGNHSGEKPKGQG